MTQGIMTRAVPDLVAAYARKIQRLVAALQAIGLLLGGNAGARLAQGLQEDLAAVKAGLTLPWSSGPVEGQITRLSRSCSRRLWTRGLPALTAARAAGHLRASGTGNHDQDTTSARTR